MFDNSSYGYRDSMLLCGYHEAVIAIAAAGNILSFRFDLFIIHQYHHLPKHDLERCPVRHHSCSQAPTLKSGQPFHPSSILLYSIFFSPSTAASVRNKVDSLYSHSFPYMTSSPISHCWVAPKVACDVLRQFLATFGITTATHGKDGCRAKFSQSGL